MNILGISALYHDSAAALCRDGVIAAAASEERFTRKKADSSLPKAAIDFCLQQLENGIDDLDAVVFYDNSLLKLDRWISNAIWVSPNNNNVIHKMVESVLSDKIWIHERIRSVIGSLGRHNKLLACEHHVSHAASAFYPSPFEEAAIVTLDGVGEWATTTIGYGNGKDINVLEEIRFPHSLGLLYSAFTYFCGFKVNFGEYKLMGLAPYGEPIYYQTIIDHLVDIKEDGSFRLYPEYFSFMTDDVMTGEAFEKLFKMPRRMPEQKITKEYMDIAASIQKVTEEIVIKIVRHAKKITNSNHLVMAGGIALNCVANGKILRSGMFDDLWIQPAAGDAGGALGAALYAEYNYFDGDRKVSKDDSQNGSFLGPSYKLSEIKKYLDSIRSKYHYIESEELYRKIGKLLAEDKVIGLFNGRMEFGPRALGGRSIIANPMSKHMQAKLNLKIKFRESFRPFAPAVLNECKTQYFGLNVESPYMLLVDEVKNRIVTEKGSEISNKKKDIDLIQIINECRSDIPAVTHVDYSARIQTVTEDRNPYLYQVIREFEKLTGCGVVVNTSFNVRGEPIVCTPKDAYTCFMRTDMDVLVLENYILFKDEQPEFTDVDWRSEYELD